MARGRPRKTDHRFREALGRKLRELRGQFQYTLAQIGQQTGVSAASVAAWETGKSAPSEEMLDRLAQIYNTTARALRYGVMDEGSTAEFVSVGSFTKDREKLETAIAGLLKEFQKTHGVEVEAVHIETTEPEGLKVGLVVKL